MMTIWDNIVKQDHHLRGTDWKTAGRMRTVADFQISAGAAHSGYPIVTNLDWQHWFVDLESSKKEVNWGMCHEIGHNMQIGTWTPTVS